MHQITGYFFFSKGERKYVIYSTLYSHGRYATTFDCTGLTDEQARGKFLLEHSNSVDALIKSKQKSKIILT